MHVCLFFRYTSSLFGSPPLQVIAESQASVEYSSVADPRSAVSAERSPSSPMVSGGEVQVAMTITYTFRNTCADRDLLDVGADLKLPECASVTSCVVESVIRGKITAKYDVPKRVIFARIPKIKRSAELVMRAKVTVRFIFASCACGFGKLSFLSNS